MEPRLEIAARIATLLYKDNPNSVGVIAALELADALIAEHERTKPTLDIVGAQNSPRITLEWVGFRQARRGEYYLHGNVLVLNTDSNSTTMMYDVYRMVAQTDPEPQP